MFCCGKTCCREVGAVVYGNWLSGGKEVGVDLETEF